MNILRPSASSLCSVGLIIVVRCVGRSECPDSSSTADVLVHRFPSVVSRRHQLLRSPGLQFLHTDQDRVAAVAVRGCRYHRIGHCNADPAMSRPFPVSCTLFNLVQENVDVVEIAMITCICVAPVYAEETSVIFQRLSTETQLWLFPFFICKTEVRARGESISPLPISIVYRYL